MKETDFDAPGYYWYKEDLENWEPVQVVKDADLGYMVWFIGSEIPEYTSTLKGKFGAFINPPKQD